MLRRTFIALTASAGTWLAARNLAIAEAGSDAATLLREGEAMTQTGPQTGYAPVNGLQMYYEIHGRGGVPLVLLHGAYSNFETDFGKLLPLLTASRQVIGVEQQGHGHTADIDRPLSYEQMADDTAALLRFLALDQVDVFGYSLGGGVGLQLAVRHPELVRKLIAAGGTSFSPEGFYPEVLAGLNGMTAEAMTQALAGTPWHEAYMRIAPDPDAWGALVEKKMDLDRRWQGWTPETIQSIAAPVLLIIGDSDIVRPEHTVEFFRLLGGGVPGDLTGLPKSQLAVLPGTTHVTLMWNHPEWLAAMIEPFLVAADSEEE
jgi:pimeloyl-ACP methyl ester carboxylesterase